jgi:hypothetical protein
MPANLTGPSTILLRTQFLWRLCLCLPFVYVGAAGGVEHWWFPAGGVPGFWRMSAAGFAVLMGAFGGAVAGVQAAFVLVHRSYTHRLRQPGLSLYQIAYLYWKRTLYLVAFADVASGLGLIAFLIQGSWTALLVFCMCSYVLYLQAYPRARLLCGP